MNQSHGRHSFNVDTVERALQHHQAEGRITFLERLPEPARPKRFRIRLAASYDFEALDYTLREAYMLNLGLTTMERLGTVEDQ